jgi:peptide/nickel transport system permease protein
MQTYLVKRLLLMIPTLFGISLVLWLVVTAAPGSPGGRTFGEAQTQEGAGGGESRRIFREQFNLDKPVLWNWYVSLTPEDVLAEVRATADLTLPGRARSRADERLIDWGEYAVPALVGAIDLARDVEERAHVLRRLQRNAKRAGVGRAGRQLTPQEAEENRRVLQENSWIDEHLALPATPRGAVDAKLVDERARAWKAWYAERASRWQWSFGERMRRRLFDTQFAKYWGNLLRLDLGDSHVHRIPVFQLIVSRLPISITLSVTSLALAYLISVPLGVWAAVRHRTVREQGVATLLFMLYSLPSFFVATLLLRYLGIGRPFAIIPVAGFESRDTFGMTTAEHILDVARHTVAPIFCMTYASFAALSRYAKSGVLNVIRSDYIRTARAKGLGEAAVVLKHAVRNGIIPIITLLGTTLPAIVGGSIIVESVFSIPGIGWLTIESIQQRDYNVVIGLSLIVAVLTMIGILVSDLLYAVIDPRISYS